MFCDLLRVASLLLPVLLTAAQNDQYVGGGSTTTSSNVYNSNYQYPVAQGCAVVFYDKGRKICIDYQLVEKYFWKAAKRADLASIMEGSGEDPDPYSNLENPDPQYLTILAEVLLETTKAIKEKFNLDKDNVLKYLPMVNTLKTSINQFCPFRLKTFDCSNSVIQKYRTFTGVCNNYNYPDWGMADSAYYRFLDPCYGDGISDFRASYTGNYIDLPSPRLVSLTVHEDRMMDNLKANFFWVSFCQMVNHDTTRKKGSKLDCCDVKEDYFHRDCHIMEVPKNDVWMEQHDTTCIGFARDQATLTTHCKLGAREQLNKQSSFLDLSVNYGTDEEFCRQNFRKNSGGLLKTTPLPAHLGGFDFLPCVDGGTAPCVIDAGDIRVKENPGLTVVHWVFWTLHNHICNHFATICEQDGYDEECFQKCKKITTAIYQHVLYNEHMPLLLGSKWMKMYGLTPLNSGNTKYMSQVNPTTSNVYSTAAMRYGHAFVPGFLEFRDNEDSDYSIIDTEDLSEVLLKEYTWNPMQTLTGQLLQAAHIKGPSVTIELRNKMFKTMDQASDQGVDLAALNIMRGRDRGIPDYNKWRGYCNLSPVKTWEDAYNVMAAESVDLFKQMYLSPEDLDLWTAGLSEFCDNGALVGPTFSCILARQFANFKYGDRFYYEHQGQFTTAQLAAIKEVRMSSIICLITAGNIPRVQSWAFVRPNNENNNLVKCDSLPMLDLSPWNSEFSSIDPTATSSSSSYTQGSYTGGGW